VGETGAEQAASEGPNIGVPQQLIFSDGRPERLEPVQLCDPLAAEATARGLVNA